MLCLASIAGIELLLPNIEQRQRLCLARYFVSQIVRNAAVGIDAMKMRPQLLRQKPRSDVKVLIVRLSQFASILLRLRQRWGAIRHPIRRRKRRPSLFRQYIRIRYCMLDCRHGRITVLISFVRRIIPWNTETRSRKGACPVMNASASKAGLAINASALRQTAGVWWKLALSSISL